MSGTEDKVRASTICLVPIRLSDDLTQKATTASPYGRTSTFSSRFHPPPEEKWNYAFVLAHKGSDWRVWYSCKLSSGKIRIRVEGKWPWPVQTVMVGIFVAGSSVVSDARAPVDSENLRECLPRLLAHY